MTNKSYTINFRNNKDYAENLVCYNEFCSIKSLSVMWIVLIFLQHTNHEITTNYGLVNFQFSEKKIQTQT